MKYIRFSLHHFLEPLHEEERTETPFFLTVNVSP